MIRRVFSRATTSYAEWAWQKETPETVARYVSPRCATGSFKNIRRVDGQTVYDARAAGDHLGIMAALYQRLRSYEIAYDNEGYLPGGDYSQRVRSPAEIADLREATCLDTSILFSGLALSLGLRPVIVLFEDHALVAIATVDDLVIDRDTDREAVIGMLEQELLIPLETTGFTVGERTDFGFEEALDRGRQRLVNGEFDAAIDPKFLHDRDVMPVDCPARFNASLVLSIGLGALVLSGVVLAAFFLRRPLTMFSDETSGVVLLPSVQISDGQSVDDGATNDFTKLFDDKLLDVANESGTLAAYQLADNVGGYEIADAEPDARSVAAAEIVALSNAAVVIAPSLDLSSNTAQVDIDVWIGNVDSAEELAGQEVSFLFCSRQTPTVVGRFDEINVDTADNFSDLARRTDEYVADIDALLRSISDYRNYRIRDADVLLSELIDRFESEGCAPRPEIALLLHMQGNIRADLGEYGAASSAYQAALDVDDGFNRSLMGLAEVGLLSSSIDGCDSNDSNQIARSRRQFEAFLETSEAGDDALLSIKGRVGLGRTLVCRAGALESLGRDSSQSLAAAKASFDIALDSYEVLRDVDDPLWRSAAEPAAIGYLERADLSLRQFDLSPDVDDSVTEPIIGDYETASNTSTRPWVLARAEVGIADVCQAIGDRDCETRAQDRGCLFVANAREILGDREDVLSDELGELSDRLCR